MQGDSGEEYGGPGWHPRRWAATSAPLTSSPPPPVGANSAITLSRMFSATSAGIAPSLVLSFIGAQVLGAALAPAAIKVVYPG